MPIAKKWSRATPGNIESHAPMSSGVYELKAFGKLVYVGRASNLQHRLLEHLNQRNPNYYRYETAGLFQRPSSMEAEHLEVYESKHGKLPPWNERAPTP